MKKLSLVIAIIVLTAPNISGFDGDRKGFVLGGSAGPAYATFDHKYYERAESVSVQTALIVGKGLSERLTFTYTGLQFWPLDTSPSNSKVMYVLLPSVEVRYYRSTFAPSNFYSLGLGFSVYDDTEGEFDVSDGLTPHVGVGYEFSTHYSIEAKIAYTIRPGGSHESLINAMLLVTALAY